LSTTGLESDEVINVLPKPGSPDLALVLVKKGKRKPDKK